MSYCLHHERSLFEFDEFQPILKTHHPFVEDLEMEDLTALRALLRDRRLRERTHARDRRREARGKGPARGASVPGTQEQPLRRKQVYASALKRLNAEITRRQRIESRAANVEAARKALAMRKSAGFRKHPPIEAFLQPDRLRDLPGRKRRPIVHGARIGSISQANKVAQATRDGRR